MTQRNVAIVGAGIGAEHFRAFQHLPEQFRVHTICELNSARAQPLLDAAPQTRLVDDLETALADPEIDLVDVCLPPHLHFDACVRALQAGKHVICEKPLVSSVREADQLAEVARQSGRDVFPVFQYRFGRGAAQLRALMDAGLTGKAFVASLETHWNRGGDYYAVDWRGTWAGEQGGAILGHAIHIHDWAGFILGPVGSVYAMLDTRVNDIEVEDCAAITMRMESGAVVTSSVTLGAANDTSRLRFCFEGLTAESGSLPYAPAQDVWSFIARDPFGQDKIDAVLQEVPDASPGYIGLFEAISDALDGGDGRHVTLMDARRSLEFVSAVYGSARTGLPVSLPLSDGHPMYDGWVPNS